MDSSVIAALMGAGGSILAALINKAPALAEAVKKTVKAVKKVLARLRGR